MGKQQLAEQNPSLTPGPGMKSSTESGGGNRYGAPKRQVKQRTKTVLLTLAFAAAIITVVYFVAGNTSPVTNKDVGFVIKDATYATVTFQVTKEPQATARCAVQVLSKNFAVVGWKVVTIGPDGGHNQNTGERSTVHRIGLRTESQGVSGGIDSCWIANT